VQLTALDRAGKLKVIDEMLRSISEDALTYFSRANDQFFDLDDGFDTSSWEDLDFTDPKNIQQVVFRFKVRAYSGIGDGAVFEVNFREETFRHVPTTGTSDEHPDNHLDDSGCTEADEDEDEDEEEGFNLNETFVENLNLFTTTAANEEDDEDSSSVASDDSDDDDDDEIEDPVDAANRELEKRSFGQAPREIYDPSKMVTGVDVTHHQAFGKILRSNEKAKAIRQKDGGNQDESAAVEQRSVLARAVSIAVDCINQKKVDISDGKDEMKEYNLVDNWKEIPDDALYREKGWARRPTEEMYGPSYFTDEIRGWVVEWYKNGSDESTNKQSPAMMEEKIKELRPGLYCNPGQTELAKAVSGMCQKEKNGKDPLARRVAKVPAEIEAKIRDLMAINPSLKGAGIEKELASSYGQQKPLDYNRKAIMEKVNYWRRSDKEKAASHQKKALIG
jgi:hypothetical protein